MRMNTRLIVTRSDDRVKNIASLTHPIIKSYADYCGADFKIISGPPDEPHPKYHYRLFKLYDLFDEYERILHLDTDILIRNCCPNLFDIVPYDKIGTILEDKGSRKENRRSTIRQIQEEREDIGWEKNYTNCGCILFSKNHRELFNPKLHKYPLWEKNGTAEAEMGYRIHMLGFDIHELDYKFNHLSMFSEEWHNHANRFNSYIIHYAGGGFYRFMSQYEQIKQDLALLVRFYEISS